MQGGGGGGRCRAEGAGAWRKGQEGAEGAGAGRRGQVREREGGARGGEGKGMHAIWIVSRGGGKHASWAEAGDISRGQEHVASLQAGQRQGSGRFFYNFYIAVHIPRLTAFARRPSGPLPAGQR